MDISWERLNKILEEGGEEALNAEWDKLFEELIATFPEEKREMYRSKQWAYKRDMNKIKNPIARFAEAKKRMWDSFFALHEALSNPAKYEANKREAHIFEFTKREN